MTCIDLLWLYWGEGGFTTRAKLQAPWGGGFLFRGGFMFGWSFYIWVGLYFTPFGSFTPCADIFLLVFFALCILVR